MKVLVLGAGGMAGHTIALRLMEYGHDVTGFARRKLDFCHSIIADATDELCVERLVKAGEYDVIVNSIGVLNEINFRPAYGIWANSYFPHRLAEMIEDIDSRIVHISTDCVFSGHDDGKYDEASVPNATDYYGRSKLLGELDDEKNLTFRMSIVGPDINQDGKGLFHWFMREPKAASGYSQVFWTGCTTITLADAIDAAIRQNLKGIYHLVNNQVISKYELLKLFNDIRKYPITIARSDDYHVDKSLINTRTDFDFEVPGYGEMVERMRDWIVGYHKYYPWYDVK